MKQTETLCITFNVQMADGGVAEVAEIRPISLIFLNSPPLFLGGLLKKFYLCPHYEKNSDYSNLNK